MPELAAFHFLRPYWLLGLVPTLYLVFWLRRRHGVHAQLQGIVAPHLLDHLTDAGSRGRRLRPAHLLPVVLGLVSLALAGPTWARVDDPLADDEALLVIAVDVSPSMLGNDVQPTRLARAKQKVRDLLDRRPGARTALVAYADTAHTVLPLCTDGDVLRTFLEPLKPAMMPRAGKRPDRALALATSIVGDARLPSSVLFLTDGVPSGVAGEFAAALAATPCRVAALALTRDARELASLEAADIDVVRATANDADVRRIDRGIARAMRASLDDDATRPWADFGYSLVWPLLLLALFWGRRGWTIRWVPAVAVVPVFMTQDALQVDVSTEPVTSFVDYWATKDQQGRWAYERGRYADAARRFEEPMWRGIALYRSQQFEAAVDVFATIGSADAHFNRGNALAQLRRYKSALRAYDRALQLRPGDDDVLANRRHVLRVLELLKSQATSENEKTGKQDEKVQDEVDMGEEATESTEIGKLGQRELTDDELNTVWMRRVRQDPADFLRAKFAQQLQREERGK